MKATYSRGKHLKRKRKQKSKNKKKVVLYIFLLVVCTFLAIKILKNNENVETTSGQSNSVAQQIDTETAKDKEVPEIVKVDMPDKIESFDVIGELIIEKINFKNYILSKTTDDSLDFSVTKFYGPKVNQEGNLCITGHNTKEYLFKNLKELEKDDIFYIIDKENFEKVTYKVFDKYTVIPTDLECLNQNTNNNRQVTLITCSPRRVNKTYYQGTRGIEESSLNKKSYKI